MTESIKDHLPNCTDQHVAEKYRQYRNFAIESYEELLARGYRVEANGVAVKNVAPTALINIFKLEKKEL